MKCRVCGGLPTKQITDLPFKTDVSSIVIIKALPVLQCGQCGETELDSTTMKRVDELLAVSDGATELGVIRYAA